MIKIFQEVKVYNFKNKRVSNVIKLTFQRDLCNLPISLVASMAINKAPIVPYPFTQIVHVA